MPELISRADANEAVVELLGERIAAVLADLDEVIELHTGMHLCHSHDWMSNEMDAFCTVHEGDICTTRDKLTRIRRTLTGEDHHA